MSPYRYKCSTVGYMASFFTMRNLVIGLILCGLTYYGWPVIEAVLLFLPIPDPRNMKDKAKEYCNMFLNGGNNAGGSALGKSSGVPTSGYKQQFGATGTLQDEDDSGDEDDEEDIAVPVGDLGPNHLVETSANFWGWEVLQYSLLLSSRCLRKRRGSTYQRQTENKRMSKVASREFSF